MCETTISADIGRIMYWMEDNIWQSWDKGYPIVLSDDDAELIIKALKTLQALQALQEAYMPVLTVTEVLTDIENNCKQQGGYGMVISKLPNML